MLLEDLLPLEDLHDPFLELDQVELGGGAAPADLAAAPQHMSLHQMHAAAVAHGIDPSDPSALFSPSTTGFFGIPAYAEPDSPAAAAFNNSAGMLLAQQGSTPRVPGLPLHPGAFTAVHAFAAASSANDSHGLPPAIAAAQKRVAQQLQMQAQMQAQAQQAQQPAAQPQQPQPAQSLPVASALNAEAKACSSGAGGSHVSHGSADSGAAAATATTTATAPQYSAMQQCAVSDSSSGGAGVWIVSMLQHARDPIPVPACLSRTCHERFALHSGQLGCPKPLRAWRMPTAAASLGLPPCCCRRPL